MNELIKSPKIFGLTGKLETSYGAGGAPSAATDGILLESLPQITIAAGFDGSRPAPAGTMGTQRRVPPNGISASLPVAVAIRGAGAAYSASVVPSIHTLLRICGFDDTLTSTPGSEKHFYTPTPGPVGYGSGVFNAYARGELWPITAAYADWSIAGDSTGVAVFTATISALLGAIADQITPPVITYSLAAVVPPTCVGANIFTLGLFTNANLLKWSVKGARKISPRLRQVAGGHAGFAIGDRAPTLDVTYETPALAANPFHAASTIDPYNLFYAATQLAWALQIGSVQYNRCKISGPAAQIMAPPQINEDGDSVVTNLSLQINPSAANLNDDVSFTFD